MNLSPLTIDRIRNGNGGDAPVAAPVSAHDLRRYRRWGCSACGDVHSVERDAMACCPRDADEVFVDPDSGEHFDSMRELMLARSDRDGDVDSCTCPVCRVPAKDTHDAANCCLWRDVSALERMAVANAVEAGATWAEALGLTE